MPGRFPGITSSSGKMRIHYEQMGFTVNPSCGKTAYSSVFSCLFKQCLMLKWASFIAAKAVTMR